MLRISSVLNPVLEAPKSEISNTALPYPDPAPEISRTATCSQRNVEEATERAQLPSRPGGRKTPFSSFPVKLSLSLSLSLHPLDFGCAAGLRTVRIYQDDATAKRPYHCTATDCTEEYRTAAELRYTSPLSQSSSSSLLMHYRVSRKHVLRHTKPYKCKVSGCRRTTGFSTTNDLHRHQRSVHAASGDPKYRCRQRNCPKQHKLWTRADNFRTHLARLHQVSISSRDIGPYRCQ